MWDHPRLCGEKPSTIPKSINFTGITPAYAGKSAAPLGTDQMRRDHPRLCGEKAFKVPERSTKVGSPPPMRGKA